jgi:ferric-dicitrate binding protein FerR (iron transport regulator)
MDHDKRTQEPEPDLVATLIRVAGKREEPPEEAYRQVLAAASAAFREKTARRRERLWVMWAAAAAALVIAVALVFQWSPPGAQRYELARVERAIGAVERATGEAWQPVGESQQPLTRGTRLRTLAGARAALRLAGGDSLRLAPGTEIELDDLNELQLHEGMLYLDHRGSVGRGVRITTPAGNLRDLGTQFELRVTGSSMRLRVREGRVEIERAGQQLTGSAGEQLDVDAFGSVLRSRIAPDAAAWGWAEELAPAPDIEGRPAIELLDWVARETGRTLLFADAAARERAQRVVLHGNIRHLAPLDALEVMLATTDLEYSLIEGRIEIRTRAAH